MKARAMVWTILVVGMGNGWVSSLCSFYFILSRCCQRWLHLVLCCCSCYCWCTCLLLFVVSCPLSSLKRLYSLSCLTLFFFIRFFSPFPFFLFSFSFLGPFRFLFFFPVSCFLFPFSSLFVPFLFRIEGFCCFSLLLLPCLVLHMFTCLFVFTLPPTTILPPLT